MDANIKMAFFQRFIFYWTQIHEISFVECTQSYNLFHIPATTIWYYVGCIASLSLLIGFAVIAGRVI